MSRYRKIDPRVWNDAKFRDLSDNAKLVFFMLLTHPNMTALGAMRSTLAGLAEELGWEPEAFREAFREVLNKGMVEHDQKACFIALPKFLRYNQPESPNVVKAWVGALDLLPECGLKTVVIQRARSFLDGYKEAFGEAFREAFAKSIANQEQEQEQEQEKEIPPNPPSPDGDEGAELDLQAKPKRERKPRVALKTFLEACKANGVKPVTSYTPLMEYVEGIKLPHEFLELAWDVFCREHLPGGANAHRLQADWQRHFCNYVTKGYYRLWVCKADGSFELTTLGQQSRKFLEAA